MVDVRGIQVARLIRYYSGLKATLGILKLDVAHSPIYTLELPWQQNKPEISCIPEGVYKVEPYSSEKYPNVYQICDVPGRSAILIHIGNYPTDTHGCVLVGKGVDPTTPMVSSSKQAMELLVNELAEKEFTLTIESA